MTELLTVLEAYKKLRIGRTKFYRLMNEGKITAKKLDKRTFISQSTIDKYVSSLPNYKQ